MTGSSITIDVSDILRFAAQMAPAATKRIVDREFGTAMKRSTAQIQHDAQTTVKWDRGDLRRSITTDVTPYYGAVFSDKIYARAVEEGFPPGKWIPPGVLLGWMARKNIPEDAEFAIRLKIFRVGIEASPYLQPALERNLDAIDREFDVASLRIVSAALARR